MPPPSLRTALCTSLCASVLLSGCGGGSSSSAVEIRSVPGGGVTSQPDWTGPDSQYLASAAATHNADAAYDKGLDGSGVRVGVIDGGVSRDSGVLDGRLFVDTGYTATHGSGDSPDGSHGTGVASIIAAQRGGTSGMHGVAPNADIVDYNVAASQAGKLSLSSIGDALNAAARTKLDVVNISAESEGHVGDAYDGSETLIGALRAATEAGVVVVVAAGNDGAAQPSILAGLPLYMSAAYSSDSSFDLARVAQRFLTVAALTADGSALADFSNKCGDARAFCISAQGVDVRMVGQDGLDRIGSGTSFAAPLVAGAFALLRQMWPDLGEEEIVEIILRTADDIGAAGVDEVFGYGRLNVARAVEPVGAMTLPRESVSRQYDGAGGVYASATVVASSAMAPALERMMRGGAAIAAFDSYGRGFSIPMAAFAAEAERMARAREDFGSYVNRRDAILSPAPGVTLRLRADPRGAARTASVGFAAGGALLTVARGEDVSDIPGVAAFAAHAPAAGMIDPEQLRNPYLALIEEGYGASAMAALGGGVSAGAFLLVEKEGAAQAAGASLNWRGEEGDVTVSLGVLEEEAAMLGATGSGALAFGDSRTLFASVSGRAALNDRLALIGDAHIGQTEMTAGGGYLTGARARAHGWNLGLERIGVIGREDVATLSVGQELGVSDGSIELRAADRRGVFSDQRHDLSGPPVHVARFGWRGALDHASSLALGLTVRMQEEDEPEFLGGARLQTRF